MLVNLYDTDGLVVADVDLDECLDRNDLPDAYEMARTDLERDGIAYVGGGAAPLFTLTHIAN